jgi:hypothetical protein
MTRSRNITMAASDCPPLSDAKACDVGVCARDCVVGVWSSWTSCSATCGGGRRERTRVVTQMPAGSGAACPLDLTQSEQCGTQACTPPGLACSEYTACTDCTDNGKTSPRVCQFCSGASSGVCQSLHLVEGNATSGLHACPIGFDTRATSIAACAMLDSQGSVGSTTTAQEVVETVDMRSVLKLGANETTALADVTLSNGVRLQVRVVGEEGAMVRALEDGGVGAFSPSRDGAHANNATNMQGRLRAGLSMEFLFAKDRPVSFRRLVLGAWDATDEGQLELGNDKNAADSDAPTPGKRRRGMGAVVMIRDAESSFEAETAAGYTKYVLSANGDSDFSVKSFEFVVRGSQAQTAPLTTSASQAQINAPMANSGGFVLDTMTIALIAAGAALCLIIVVAIIVVLARRKARASPAASDIQNSAVQSSGIASGIGMEMRPALSRVESSLAVSETAPPPFATISSVASDDKYLPLAIQPMPNSPYQNPRGGLYHAPGGASADRYGQAAGGSGLIAAINSAASYEVLPLSTPPGQAHVGQYRGVPAQPQPDNRMYNVVDAIDGGTYDASGSAYLPLPQQPLCKM